MRAVRSLGGRVEVADVDLSGPDDWPIVEVVAAGICGSDLHLVAAGPTSVTLGHEFAGRLADGTDVVVLPHVACGRCAPCLAGHPQRCAREQGFLGISLDGGMAERVRVPPSAIRAVPDGVAAADACLAEPLAVGVHGVHRVGVDEGARVLVVGAGPIGLAAVAVAADLGAAVAVAELRADRLERAAALGAIEPDEGGYDIVFDAAGTQASLDLAIRRCTPGGTVGILATHWEPVEIGIGLQLAEVSLVPAYLYGCHHGRHAFDLALDLLSRSGFAEAVVSHRLELSDAERAFELAASDPTAAKVVLEPA